MQIDEAHHQNCFLLRKMDCARAKIPWRTAGWLAKIHQTALWSDYLKFSMSVICCAANGPDFRD
jgi:hypothetical protein